MREHALYQSILDGGREEKWVLYRIQDGSFGRKPFDIAGADPTGRAVGLEVKRAPRGIRYELPVEWARFEVHQVAWLKAFTQSRGMALVALHDDPQEKLYLCYFPDLKSYDRPAADVIVGCFTKLRDEFRGWSALLDEIERRMPTPRRRYKQKKVSAAA